MGKSESKPGLLVSFGGNALNVPESDHPHQKEEFKIARRSLEGVVELLERGYRRMILCHGNGPQVGQIFLQQELTRHDFPRQVTLDVCVADSQGRIGYILQNVLDNLCQERGMKRKCFAVITQVVVDPNDPAWQKPTKPIGLFYSKEEADDLAAERGWVFMEDAGRGFRRVVPSPKPMDIIEKNILKNILDSGFIPIGGGGGGIPVVRTADGDLCGVEAVIDKDHTSALLANEMGLELLVILTGVDHAYLDYQTPEPKPLKKVTIKEMEGCLERGEFAEGSMKPKVEAALEFLRRGGKKAVIAHLDDLVPAMEEKTGTHIVPE